MYVGSMYLRYIRNQGYPFGEEERRRKVQERFVCLFELLRALQWKMQDKPYPLVPAYDTVCIC
jgi:hypothetical protein